jgi:LysM repeat protein
VTAGLAVLLIGGGGLGSAAAQGVPAQERYVVRPGDSLDQVAATFGVDPAAVAAASGLGDSAVLTPAEILVIPAPGEPAGDAARIAAGLEGTSPFVLDAHVVEPGETLAAIAAGYGVSPQAIADFNGVADPDVLTSGQRLLIPPAVGGEDGGEARAATGVFVPHVPTHVQERNLSCEYAAASIATGTFGAAVPESAFLQNVPAANNPHWGYRGNIDGWWGNTDDYGVYAEALVPTLNAYGFAGEVFYSEGDPAALTQRIDAGKPVLTWLGLWGNTAVTLQDEGTYKVAAGTHVVTVYGYNAQGVYASDPATGDYHFYPWDQFLAMWGVLDGMALAVWPE